MLGLWNNIDKFYENKSEFKNWIAGIAKFKAIDYSLKFFL
ncbi:sigma factor [Clostridium butyricum]|uniref:RNA polymerase, sigma-24 subunit, ECF subfamily n=1 Tax=Clostridium butyricum E4 str. BoNT E BL5262 TaxID=632245 RepID=C4IN06_CLOBU|nr:sigma factor [Clostridium butyricum]EEP52318.1 RNA polymerase, sigma-24 subunit, ECF subfamily [Clostridium butyricum E4 str. BoNT E BL5262]